VAWSCTASVTSMVTALWLSERNQGMASARFLGGIIESPPGWHALATQIRAVSRAHAPGICPGIRWRLQSGADRVSIIIGIDCLLCIAVEAAVVSGIDGL